MARVFIRNGIWIRYYEPYDMPGALIRVEHRVEDREGGTPASRIDYDGPGFAMDYPRRGKWGNLWLGRENAVNPMIVAFRRKPTRASDQYEKGYRRGFKLKRRFRSVSPKATSAYVEGLQQGWADNPNRKQRRNAGKQHLVGGRADRCRPRQFDQRQLRLGIRVEREHTRDPRVAQEIAMDHLVEIPDYYTHLARMERRARKRPRRPQR